MTIKSRYNIQKAVARSRKPLRPFPALVGDGNGVIEVPGSPGSWYVRPVGSELVIPVYRGNAPRLNNYPVWVGQDIYNRRWVRILGSNVEGGGGGNSAGDGGDLEPHSHYLTDGNMTYISSRQIVELLLSVTAGMTVQISGGFAVVGGQPVYVVTQTLDLSSYVPVAGALWAIIRADDAGTLSVQEGETADSYADLNYNNLPAVEAGYKELWAVKLYEGQTAISGRFDSPDYQDLRYVQSAWATDGSLVINERGQATGDVRMEGDTEDTLFFLDASGDVVRIGDGDTNYTQWDKTGHQTMVGTAQPWDDLRVEPVTRTTGVNAPTFEKWYDDAGGTSRGVYLYSFDNAVESSQKEVFFTMQLPHAWNQDDIDIHVHWVAESTAASSKVRWGLEYVWKSIGEVFGDTTIIYADTDTEGATGTTANEHKVTEFGLMSPGTTQDDISSILICRLFRHSSDAADTYTGKVGLLYVDAHYQVNSIGSNDEYVK